MSLFSRLGTIDQKFAWSFLGVLLAMVFGGITIYSEFIMENSPDLNYEITSNADVLDVRETIGNLDILYNGSSLSRNDQSLRIMTLRVANRGDQSILSNYYDPNDPIGFAIENGRLVDDPTLLESSSSYLQSNLNLTLDTLGRVTFSNVILEPSEYFVVKTLVLYANDDEPRIIPMGKVAGVSHIDVLNDYQTTNDESVWTKSLGGGVWVHLIRFVVYAVVFIVLFISMMFISESVSSRSRKRKRVNAVMIFKEYNPERLAPADEYFFEVFVEDGSAKVVQIKNLLEDQRRMKYLVRRQLPSSLLERAVNMGTEGAKRRRRTLRDSADRQIFERLLSEKIVVRTDDSLSVDQERKTVLDDFLEFLKRKELLNPRLLREGDLDRIEYTAIYGA